MVYSFSLTSIRVLDTWELSNPQSPYTTGHKKIKSKKKETQRLKNLAPSVVCGINGAQLLRAGNAADYLVYLLGCWGSFTFTACQCSRLMLQIGSFAKYVPAPFPVAFEKWWCSSPRWSQIVILIRMKKIDLKKKKKILPCSWLRYWEALLKNPDVNIKPKNIYQDNNFSQVSWPNDDSSKIAYTLK